MGFSQLGSNWTSWAKHHQNLGKTGIGMWRIYLRCIDHQPQCLQGHDMHFKAKGQAAARGWICCTVGRACLLSSWWAIFPFLRLGFLAMWRRGWKEERTKPRAPASPWCVPRRCRNQRRSRACCCTRSTAAPSLPSPARCGSAAPPPPACPRRPPPRPCAGTWPSLKEPDPLSGLLCQCCCLPPGFPWWGSWKEQLSQHRVLAHTSKEGRLEHRWHPRSWWDVCNGGSGIFGLHLSRGLNQQSVRQNTFPTLKRNCGLQAAVYDHPVQKSPDDAAAGKSKSPGLVQHFPQWDTESCSNPTALLLGKHQPDPANSMAADASQEQSGQKPL